MIEGKSVFPVFDSISAGTDYQCVDAGIDLRAYAAVHLKIPVSGDPEIDKMIRESRRADFAAQALAGLVVKEAEGGEFYEDMAVKRAFDFADTALAEWEKEAGK
jgi:hypothetical protein